MKKLIVSLIVALMALPMFAQEQAGKGVKFETGTLEEILAKAAKNKKAPKLVFIDCYTTWCGPCKMMANTIFPQEAVGNFMNANFICTKFDMEKEGVDIAKKYKIRAYPTFLILDAQGNEVNRFLGSSDAETFIKRVKTAMDPQSSPSAKKAKYESDKSGENAIAYMKALEDTYMESELVEFAKDYFAGLKPAEKYSFDTWNYYTKLLSNPDSESFKNFMAEKSIASNYLSKELVDKTIISSLKRYGQLFMAGRLKDADTSKVLEAINYINIAGTNDKAAECIARLVPLYAAGKMDEIVKLFNINEMMKYNMSETMQIENLFSQIKGFPKDKIADYLNAKAEFYTKQAEQLKKQAENFKK
jgi:thiol-disulfide isomerase/thioredoxin